MNVNECIQISFELDKFSLFKKADAVDSKLLSLAQQVDLDKIKPLDINQTNTPAAPQQLYDAGTVDRHLNIGPNDPPQVIPIKDARGGAHNILVLHGSIDGKFLIPGPGGALMSADKPQFDEWRKSKGYINYPWVSCYNGNVANTGNMNRLLRGTSQFELSTIMLPNNTTHLLIKSL